jgi:hypothetical protein
MRAVLGGAVAVVLLAGGVSGVASAKAVHRSIPCSAGKLVASSPEARVLSYRANLYACMSGARRARWVTPVDRDFFNEPEIPLTLMSGHWIVFNTTAEGHCADYYVNLADARSGIVWHRRLPAGYGYNSSPANGCSGVGRGPLTAAAVREDGAMAYINGPGDRDGDTWATAGRSDTYEVMVSDWVGQRSVATGADIDPSHVTISGDVVTWTQGGEPRTAFLAPTQRPAR